MGNGQVRDLASVPATVGAAWGMWRTMSEISPRAISNEAARGFQIALIGAAEDVERLREAWLTDRATDAERLDAENRVKAFTTTPDEDAARGFDFLIWPGADDAPIGVRSRNAVPIHGKLDEIVEGMIELRPDLTLALARRFPRFRTASCRKLVRDISRINAQIAFFSALPGVLPVTLPFLPVSSIADVVLLTKNQAMLVMRLAAAHGQKPGYTRQVGELLSTVAAALGWRTLAREAAGFIPAGPGVALKTAIAYSGTVAVGRAALAFYQKGIKPTAAEIRAFEADARADGEAEATRLKEAIEEKVADAPVEGNPARATGAATEVSPDIAPDAEPSATEPSATDSNPRT